MRIRVAAAVAALTVLVALPVRAQETPVRVDERQAAPARKGPPPVVPLRVTVVLSRYQGEKRVSSMPYAMGVSASGYGPPPKTTLRMGVDVPVTMTVTSGTDKATPVNSYQYRNIGTNIDCTASYEEATPGLFQLGLIVSDSSISLDASKRSSESAGVLQNIPAFRTFNSSFTALLRDGQTLQYTSATDPVTAEVMKIDVTVNIMK